MPPKPTVPGLTNGPVPAAAAGPEVTLHELGEALITSAISMQRELRRYQESNGAFIIDDMEIDLPLKVRLDDIGQVMAQVVSEAADGAAVTRIRLRIRPDQAPVQHVPVIGDQPLKSLGSLDAKQVSYLEAHRIFSVEDLLRASRTVAVRAALHPVIPEARLDDALARATLLSNPVLPAAAGAELLKAGVKSVEEFVARKPEDFAPALKRALGTAITPDMVKQWQASLQALRTEATAQPAVDR